MPGVREDVHHAAGYNPLLAKDAFRIGGEDCVVLALTTVLARTHRSFGMVDRFYHFVRLHNGLDEELSKPVQRKAKQQPSQKTGITLPSQDSNYGGWPDGQTLDASLLSMWISIFFLLSVYLLEVMDPFRRIICITIKLIAQEVLSAEIWPKTA